MEAVFASVPLAENTMINVTILLYPDSETYVTSDVSATSIRIRDPFNFDKFVAFRAFHFFFVRIYIKIVHKLADNPLTILLVLSLLFLFFLFHRITNLKMFA